MSLGRFWGRMSLLGCRDGSGEVVPRMPHTPLAKSIPIVMLCFLFLCISILYSYIFFFHQLLRSFYFLRHPLLIFCHPFC
jgi:hypothetical protein